MKFDYLSVNQRKVSLASVQELESQRFTDFMSVLNSLAKIFNLRIMMNWSKVWEYPWLWFNGLISENYKTTHICDLGSELSSMPWYMASLGAHVVLVENDNQYIQTWESIKKSTDWSVDWRIVNGEKLPFADKSFDIVTSFSVIEHLPNKTMAIEEVGRILKPGGIFAISFDICEPSLGMTFPEWNGSALTTSEFEKIIWENPLFTQDIKAINWNFEDSKEFIKWHLQSAPHHNYIVGAAILIRAS
jgi:2-polyprenyl-3-methyl-5-hydroxy-6-metoxy-1,4-benzoquinol methylase